MDSDSERGGNDPTNFLPSLSVWERGEKDDLRARHDDVAAFYPPLTNRWPKGGFHNGGSTQKCCHFSQPLTQNELLADITISAVKGGEGAIGLDTSIG